jgi:hypothetical protein
MPKRRLHSKNQAPRGVGRQRAIEASPPHWRFACHMGCAENCRRLDSECFGEPDNDVDTAWRGV